MARILGLDIGEKRIGVAISDPDGILATPLSIIDYTDSIKAMEEIVGIVSKQGVGLVVVGLPRSLSGSLGVQAEKVQEFIDGLKSRLGVPIEVRDERFSTMLARRLLRGADRKAKDRRKTRDDAAAAAVILQAYLDERRKPEAQEL